MSDYQLKGAFDRCLWCYGRGCNQCDVEREKYRELCAQPIFTADRNDPEDMAALKRVFHADKIRAAFAPGGGGMAEIEQNAAIESVLQILRKHGK